VPDEKKEKEQLSLRKAESVLLIPNIKELTSQSINLNFMREEKQNVAK
jgi:hypothetical protein